MLFAMRKVMSDERLRSIANDTNRTNDTPSILNAPPFIRVNSRNPMTVIE
jgi:hypothetical protein